jgi:pimeloyl-ACP methyl ester carboxylesterase
MANGGRGTARAIELPGRGTAYVREVEGPAGAPTIVLLHGLGATAGLNWRPSFGALSRHFRVVGIDQRGHGRGVPVGERFRLADCADDVAALADALGLERVIPVGYSMGGPIAQLTWRRHPDRVQGLVLCATACSFARARHQQAAMAFSPLLGLAVRSAPRRVWRSLARRALEERIGDPGVRTRVMQEVGGTDPAAVAEAGLALARFSSEGWIAEVDVPTAVVVTTRDEMVPARRQLRLANAISGATVHPVPGDHHVCVARPDLFVPALVDAALSVCARNEYVASA